MSFHLNRWIFGLAPACLALAGCATDGAGEVPLSEPETTRACGREFLRNAATLALPPADAAPPVAEKGQPLKVASEFPVGAGPYDIGRWHIEEGLSVWRLRLTSEGASHLSLHLRPFDLPEGAELWVCAPGGRRQGPYTAQGPNGQSTLWTPQFSGGEIRIEARVPEALRRDARFRIAKAFVGYRR